MSEKVWSVLVSGSVRTEGLKLLPLATIGNLLFCCCVSVSPLSKCLSFRQWPSRRLRAGAAAAGLRPACRVPRIRVGFDRRTGAPFGVLSHLSTLPAEFDLRTTSWNSGSSIFSSAGIVGVWLWGVCARMRAESRFKREILLYNKWTNIYTVGHIEFNSR